MTTILTALLIAVTPGAHAQSARPTFQVASIRVSSNQSVLRQGLLYTLPSGQLTARGITLRGLIFEAYDLNSAEDLVGAPDWSDEVRWDLDATATGSPSRTQMMTMLRSLLEDRFRLVVHHEPARVTDSGLFAATRNPLVIDSIQRPIGH